MGSCQLAIIQKKDCKSGIGMSQILSTEKLTWLVHKPNIDSDYMWLGNKDQKNRNKFKCNEEEKN